MNTDSDQPDTPPGSPRAMPRPMPPINVLPLEYCPVQPPQKPSVPTAVQFILGMLLIVACAILFYEASPLAHPNVFWVIVALIGTVCGMVRWKLKWVGFIPGALTAILLIPVVVVVGFAVAVLVACGIKPF